MTKNKKKLYERLETVEKLFSLKGNDDKVIAMEARDCLHSNILETIIADLDLLSPEAEKHYNNDPIPMPVDGWCLEKFKEYAEEHKGDYFEPRGPDDNPRIVLTDWDKSYLDVSSAQLLRLLMASHAIEAEGIADIICQKIADMATNKSVEQLRVLYNLENDFTPEEEEEMRQRYAWVERQ